MASPHLDLVRSLFESWERGDYSSVEWAHPDIEWVIADGPSPSRRTGVAGMIEGWRDFLDAWEGWRSRVEGYRELDDERVLVLNGYSGRGRASGLDVGEMRAGATLLHVRDGKVTRLAIYFDRERLLAELGLGREDA